MAPKKTSVTLGVVDAFEAISVMRFQGSGARVTLKPIFSRFDFMSSPISSSKLAPDTYEKVSGMAPLPAYLLWASSLLAQLMSKVGSFSVVR